MAYPRRGLLDDSQAIFNPQAPGGMFAPPPSAALPGEPAARMAGNMLEMAGQPPAAAAPAAAPRPAPASAIPSPMNNDINDTGRALMAGGIAAMDTAATGTLGASLGAGLAAGTAAFVARKDARKDVERRLAIQAQYESRVDSLPISPEAKVGLKQMGAEAGGKVLAEAGLKPEEFTTNVVDNGDSKSVVSTDKSTGKSTVSFTGAPTNSYEPDKDVQTVMLALHPGKKIGELSEAQRRAVLADAKDYGSRIAARNNNTTNVNTGVPLQTTLMVNRANRINEDLKGVNQTLTAVQGLDRAIASLDQAYTGSGAEAKLAVNQMAKEWLGIELGKDARVNTQMLQQAIDKVVIPQVKSLGFNPSNADLEAIRRSVGRVTNSRDALRSIWMWQKELAARQASMYNEDVDALRADLTRMGQTPGADLKHVEVPSTEAPTKTVNYGGKNYLAEYHNGGGGKEKGYYIETPAGSNIFKRVQ